MSFDRDAARAFALKVWKYKEGELVSLMIHLGDRLGLYVHLDGAGPVTSAALAEKAGLSERWVLEWLYGQAAAGLVVRHGDGRFELSTEASAVLVDEESLLFAAGGFTGGIAPTLVERIAEAFHTGIGFGYGDMDEATATQVDRSNSAWLRNFLVPVVVPALAGVHEKLTAGATVVDIGCGGGTAIAALADRYPKSSFLGVDVSPFAVTNAERVVADHPNAEVQQLDGSQVHEQGPFDLVMTLECLHDAPHPDKIAEAARAALHPEGTWLIKDMKTAQSFEENLKNPVLALMYGYSLSACLPSGTAQPDAAGLGTLGLHPELAKRLATEAGFSSFVVHDLDDPTHYYYEARI